MQMYSTSADRDWSARIHDTRQRLLQLRQLGYQYITTPNDGDTWVGCARPGLDISELLQQGVFLGEVDVQRV